VNLIGSLPSQYRRAATWLMRSATEASVRQLVNASGYLWPATDSQRLQGYSIGFSDALDAQGTNGAKVLIFGDLASYFVADRMSLTVQVLRERFAEYDQTGVLLKSRVGGALVRDNGVLIGGV
jgi:HK97 family phage major capsid protein